MRLAKVTIIGMIVLMASFSLTRADQTVYFSQADYNAATTGNTSVDFQGVIPANQAQNVAGNTYTRNGVVFTIDPTASNGSLFLVGSGLQNQNYGPSAVLSSQRSTTGNNLVVTLPGLFTSFSLFGNSFDFGNSPPYLDFPHLGCGESTAGLR